MDPSVMYVQAMTPIPEEGEYHVAQRTDHSVQRELYKSERVDTATRTVAQNELDSINNRQQLNPAALGPPDHTSSSYSYTYESTSDPPELVNGDGLQTETTFASNGITEVERQSYSTQKVTRMTKVTTTRTVEQTPVDADGYPIPSQSLELRDDGIIPAPAPLSPGDYERRTGGEQIRDVEAYPSAPSAPQLIDVDVDRVTLAWLIPKVEGSAGPIEGYVVECRMPTQGQPEWLPAHDGSINDTQVTVCSLQPYGEYEFRIVAHNGAGFGEPGPSTPLIHLQPRRETRLGVARVDDPHAAAAAPYPGETAVPYPPGRPQILDMDGSSVVLVWEPPIDSGGAGPVAGYDVEYRSATSPAMDWLMANDHLIREHRYTVRGLRPNGDYEFRVLAKNAEGHSLPSQSTGLVKVKPTVPMRTSPSPAYQGMPSPSSAGFSSAIPAPCQPQVTDVDVDSVRLFWPPPIPKEQQRGRRRLLGYHVECREIGDPTWFAAVDRVILEPQVEVGCLRPNSTYEFRVFAKGVDGWSEPSEVTDMVQLRPKSQPPSAGNRSIPARPGAPEVYACMDDAVTLCWAPARSIVPVQGYQVELRDSTLHPTWHTVNQTLTMECKLTVSNLELGHEYAFRVIAKNAIGYSEPSNPSEPVVPGHTYIAEGFPDSAGGPPPPAPTTHNEHPRRSSSQMNENSPTIPEEMRPLRESPPITDTDDSPPPIRRHPMSGDGGGVQWRDPTLPEVIEYLSNGNDLVRINAAGYLQHLTYSDPANKARTKELGGVPKLIGLLEPALPPELQRNACGCLRNLSYGKENDDIKVAIRDSGGVRALSDLLQGTNDAQVLEEVTGTLWNLSSADELKRPILDFASGPLMNKIVIPFSGFGKPKGSGRFDRPAFFRNACGVLRNVSSAGLPGRQKLREAPRFVECLLAFLAEEILAGQTEDKAVENVVGILRNLSYRCQEMVNPDYDRHQPPSPYERSKSAPSNSPKVKPKKDKKGKLRSTPSFLQGSAASTPRDDFDSSRIPPGVGQLWHSDSISSYLDVLKHCSNPETLEAAAGTVQNLAACYWEPSIQVRSEVRLKKGLPIFVELLRVEVDRVVAAVATALRNLAVDERNRDLIGSYAMLDLVRKLPASQQPPDPRVSDDTLTAILGVIYEAVSPRLGDSAKSDASTQYAQSFHEKGGTIRLISITQSRQMYSPRVVKYASQVLFMLWQHKELHDLYRRTGQKETDFVSRAALGPGRNGADTLARPRGSQGLSTSGDHGPRRSSRQQHPTRYGSTAGTDPQPVVRGDSNRSQPERRRSGEPVYAQVRKGDTPTHDPSQARPPLDSWV